MQIIMFSSVNHKGLRTLVQVLHNKVRWAKSINANILYYTCAIVSMVHIIHSWSPHTRLSHYQQWSLCSLVCTWWRRVWLLPQLVPHRPPCSLVHTTCKCCNGDKSHFWISQEIRQATTPVSKPMITWHADKYILLLLSRTTLASSWMAWP